MQLYGFGTYRQQGAMLAHYGRVQWHAAGLEARNRSIHELPVRRIITRATYGMISRIHASTMQGAAGRLPVLVHFCSCDVIDDAAPRRHHGARLAGKAQQFFFHRCRGLSLQR